MSKLPRGWAEADLMEIVELHDAARVPLNKSERSTRPGRYPYYGANGLVDHINDYLFDGEYVLLAEDGGNFDLPGKPVAYRVDGKFWVNNHAHIMRPRDSIPASFLLHWCNQWNWMPFVGGTTRLKLTQEGMRKVRLALPPLAEQKRIVAKLDALNAKSARARSELTRIETLASRYKQAVLNKAFSGELTREWRGDTEWPRPVRLGDVAGSFAYGSAAKSRKTGSVPVLRMGNIQDGKLDWTDLVYTDDRTEIEKYHLSAGDVLFNRTNSPALVGKTALYEGKPEAIFAGYLIRIVVGPHLNSRYLTYALNSPAGREFSWKAKTDGVSQSNISATKLKEFLFPVPDLQEQEEVVNRIEAAFARIDRLAAEAGRAHLLVGRLDEAILGRAFRGELVPQDENDEPAIVLLERIKRTRTDQPPKVRLKAAAKPRKVRSMANTIFEALSQTKDWLSAQELFERCGLRDGSSTEDVETIYRQLLDLERQKKIEIEEVADPSTGIKQGDRARLRR